jgi:hypothetical protein
MPGWLFLVAFVVVYLVLTQWLLPKPGGSHLKEPRRRPVPTRNY